MCADVEQALARDGASSVWHRGCADVHLAAAYGQRLVTQYAITSKRCTPCHRIQKQGERGGRRVRARHRPTGQHRHGITAVATLQTQWCAYHHQHSSSSSHTCTWSQPLSNLIFTLHLPRSIACAPCCSGAAHAQSGDPAAAGVTASRNVRGRCGRCNRSCAGPPQGGGWAAPLGAHPQARHPDLQFRACGEQGM